jgi:hypothetical protein
MLKEKIITIDLNKKQKFVSDVNILLLKELFYDRIKLIGQGTFGKVYLVYSSLSRLNARKTDGSMR